MAASTFTIFSSSDASGPGLLFGAAGDLIRVLDACLVTGYAGKTAVNWTKPIANASNIGCYKPASGSQLVLLVNDAGLNVTSTYKEAMVTGWESIAGVGTPLGTGTGQFPAPAQADSGRLVWRKSATADSTTGRQWVIVADASTMYIFIMTGDNAAWYMGGGFGDVFSLKGSSDAYRCMIYGRVSENSAIASTPSDWDTLNSIAVTIANSTGMYMARTFGGGGASIAVERYGDAAVQASVGSSPTAAIGGIPTPNGTDNSFYLSPIRVMESTTQASQPIRGRMRGWYHLCHPLANFSDGQTFSGANDLAGKTFMVIKQGPSAGMMAIETSATVETN